MKKTEYTPEEKEALKEVMEGMSPYEQMFLYGFIQEESADGE